MINKIEITETSLFENKTITIDLANNLIITKDNDDLITQKKLNTNNDSIINLINNYTISWKNTYKNESIIDGKTTILRIYSGNNIYTYTFKNNYPYNFSEFKRALKRLVNFNDW